MKNDDEGTDFLVAFQSTFAAPERTQERLKAERRAGLTPKQRAARKPTMRTAQINFRASKELKALSETLAQHLDISIADLMEKALQDMAKSLKVGGHK